MVTPSRTGRRGASGAGCLFSLLLMAALLYYGINLGRLWWRYWEIKNRMELAARYFTNLTDAQILADLRADAKEIGLPAEAGRFRIRRVEHPPAITIATEYRESVNLPLLKRTFVFKPSVSAKR